MNKIHLLLLSVIMLLGSCTDDNPITEKESLSNGLSPRISAISNIENETKAKVDENADYTLGEKFEWSKNDAAKVFFNNQLLTYTVSKIDKENPNSAEFTTTDVLTSDGTYDVYGFFPGDAWDLGTLEVNLSAMQKQDADSASIGDHMFMRAIKKDVSVSKNDNSPIALNYKHLGSVLRIAIKNNSTKFPGKYDLKVKSITLSATGDYKFHTKAKLETMDADALTIDPSGDRTNITLNGTYGYFVLNKNTNEYIYNGYMALLPGKAFPADQKAVVTITYTTIDDDVHYLQKKEIDVSSFWGANGIEAGKSYYIQILTGDEPVEQEYAVGDYYPLPNDVNSAIGVVFWTDPTNNGKNGKVLGLLEGSELAFATNPGNEGYNMLDVDNGYTNMRNLSLIVSDKNYSSYPMFNWAHNQNYRGEFYSPYESNSIWYIPAIAELQYLYCAFNGVEPETWTYDGSQNKSSIYPSFTPNTVAQDAFNKKITDAVGGMRLSNSGTEYTSSTEIKEAFKNVWGVSFADGYTSGPEKAARNNARTILAY